jgi:hypothetical protein
MARVERDREDLLAEATALVERVELELPGMSQHVIVGFRSTGCGSVYLGPDEAYQFNTAGQLRRAYHGGHLYKSEGGRLVQLARRRSEGQAQLIRHDLDAAETATFLGRMTEALDSLAAALRDRSHRIVGQVPEGADVVGRAVAWLSTLPPGAIARTPHAR